MPSFRLMTQTNHVGFWLKYDDNLDLPKQKFKNIPPVTVNLSFFQWSPWTIQENLAHYSGNSIQFPQIQESSSAPCF